MRQGHACPARWAGDEGTVLVEAAFIFPVLFFFLFGVFEMGLFFRSYLTLGNSLRAGGRLAAIVGGDVNADYRVLQAIADESRAINPTTFKRIVIYRANPATPTSAPPAVPPACLSASVTSGSTGVPMGSPNFCNVYNPSWALSPARVAEEFDCLAATPSGNTTEDVANGWCPTTRKTALDAAGTPANGPPDWVGVYIEFEHRYVTGIFGRTKSLSDTVVVQIEPRSLH